MSIEVLSEELDCDIKEDRFTLNSMDLPINTSVVDYRSKLHVGFWDGKAIAKQRVQASEIAVEKPSRWFSILGFLTVPVLVVGGILFRRRSL